MHSAHTRAPRSAFHDFHGPDRPCSKKKFQKIKIILIIIHFFLYEKFKELDYINNHKIQCTCI